MRRNRTRGTTSIALATTLLLGACASGPRLHHRHDYTLSPGDAHHGGLDTAILLPIDSTNEKPVKGLDVANDRIEALVVKHLESKGIAVKKVDPPRFKQALDDAYEAKRRERLSGQTSVVSADVELGDVVRQALAELGKNADLVVSTNVVMRDAMYQGTRTLVWDGVRRRQDQGDLNFSHYTAPIPVASIETTIFAENGPTARRSP